MRHLLQKYPDPLLLLRAVACLLVIGSHVQRPELYTGLLTEQFGWVQVINGHFGVWIFFILSGYLIGKGFITGRYSFSVPGLKTYYLRRWGKVYIPYVMTAFVVLAVYSVDFFRLPGILRDILLIRGNAVYLVEELSYLWTISSIVLWYFIAPFVCRPFLFFKGKTIATLILGAIILILGHLLRISFITWYPSETFPEFNAHVFIHFLPNFSFFLMGVWVNLLKLPLLLDRRSLGVGGAGIGLFIAYLVSTYYLSAVYVGYPWSFVPYGTTAGLVTTLAVLGFILATEKTDTIKKDSPGVWQLLLLPLTVIGVYSYQLYLMQTPIIKLLKLECSAAWCPAYTVFFRSMVVVILGLGISLAIKLLRFTR